MNKTIECYESALQVAHSSKCPSPNWQATLAMKLVDKRKPVTMINIGANKGYISIEFLQRFSKINVSSSDWYHGLMHHMKRRGHKADDNLCGTCDHCRTPISNIADLDVQVHAIDILPTNAIILNDLFSAFHLPAHAWNYAVVNSSGFRVSVNARLPTGYELAAAIPGADSAWRTGTTVPSITLDAFMSAQGIQHAHFVTIDAEGWDALVIEGAHNCLANKKIDVLEFEYHGLGFWNNDPSENYNEPRYLRRTLQTLKSDGYACFWQGSDGRLAEASEPCWRDAFEFRGWSNLVCTHRPGFLRSFRHSHDGY
jgi:FkbM family methyltransferase